LNIKTEEDNDYLGRYRLDQLHPSDYAEDIETIRSVMASLEQELEELNEEYRILLSHQSEISISSSGADGNADFNAAEMNSQLNNLVEKIEIKSQQLNLLRRYSSRARTAVRSPKAYNRKVQQLRALQNFRKAQE